MHLDDFDQHLWRSFASHLSGGAKRLLQIELGQSDDYSDATTFGDSSGTWQVASKVRVFAFYDETQQRQITLLYTRLRLDEFSVKAILYRTKSLE